jgi:hypothetical protein
MCGRPDQGVLVRGKTHSIETDTGDTVVDERVGAGARHTADDVVLLGDEQTSGPACDCAERVRVEGAHRMGVQHSNVHALGGQLLGCLERGVDGDAVRDDGQVVSAPKDSNTTDLEGRGPGG